MDADAIAAEGDDKVLVQMTFDLWAALMQLLMMTTDSWLCLQAITDCWGYDQADQGHQPERGCDEDYQLQGDPLSYLWAHVCVTRWIPSCCWEEEYSTLRRLVTRLGSQHENCSKMEMSDKELEFFSQMLAT